MQAGQVRVLRNHAEFDIATVLDARANVRMPSLPLTILGDVAWRSIKVTGVSLGWCRFAVPLRRPDCIVGAGRRCSTGSFDIEILILKVGSFHSDESDHGHGEAHDTQR